MLGALKVRTIIGLLIMILGVLLIVYAAFLLVQDAPGGNIPQIVGYDSVIALAGAVVFIVGVVVQGLKNIFALIVHLVAVIPYYLAIIKVQSLGNQGFRDLSTYLNQTELYWAAGIILNIIGIILNRVGKKEKLPQPPAQQVKQAQPPAGKK